MTTNTGDFSLVIPTNLTGLMHYVYIDLPNDIDTFAYSEKDFAFAYANATCDEEAMALMFAGAVRFTISHFL